ncbi:MAG: hypothetical protein EXS13_09925 [Planctomycetes bacterium]|nr:hypothetical protein [Planctomycetota bacterium]
MDSIFLRLSDHDVDEGDLVDVIIGATIPGNCAGLALVAVDGVSIFSWLVLGPTDSLVQISIQDKIPDRAGGHTYTLKAYAIGFNGKLVYGADEMLTVAP